MEYTVHEAKTHFSRLLREVAEGKEVVIARGKTPVARIVLRKGRKAEAGAGMVERATLGRAGCFRPIDG